MSKPEGRVLISTVICATMGLLVSVVLRFTGLLELPETALISLLSGLAGLNVGLKDIPPFIDLGAAFVFVALLCWGVLGSPGLLRRLAIFITVLVLIIALAPVVALFGYFISVIPAVVACVWAGLCALIYAHGHTLPCDLARDE